MYSVFHRAAFDVVALRHLRCDNRMVSARIYFSQTHEFFQTHELEPFMSWYIVLSGFYLFSLALVLMFFAGAAKLKEQADANSRAKLRVMSRRFPSPAIDRGRYRDAA
jgi:hypothetical protein